MLEIYGQNLANPAVLGALALVFWSALRLPAESSLSDEPPAAASREAPWWPVLLAALGAAAALSLGVWATGGALSARAHNALLLFGLPLLALGLILLAPRLRPALRRRLSARGVGLLALLLMLCGPLPWHGFAELGAAWRFGSANASRLDQLAAAPQGAVVEVASLPAYPLLLTQEEIAADPRYWVNRCVADYYGLAELRRSGDGPAFLSATQPYWFAWPW
jgi:hypothetical protein